MAHPRHSPPSEQHGIVLVSSLLLLLVVTIMALSVFRSFGMQERIAGNTREKQRAVQAAVSTEQYAEWWLSAQSNAPVAVSAYAAASADVACTGLVNANAGAGANPVGGLICNNTLASNGISATGVPWTTAGPGGAPLGVAYLPTGMGSLSAACVGANCLSADVYFYTPRFYIADLGSYGRSGELYQVDAYSFGLGANTISVVESTVAVSCVVCNPGAL
jgi:type IV pilus assembly protein PilX